MSFLSRVDLRFSLMQAYGNHLKYSTGANSAQDDRWAQYEILYRIARSIAGYPTDSTMRDTIEGFLERVKNDPTLTSFKAALMGTSP